MEEQFKTVSIRKKSYDYIDEFAFQHGISKAQALETIINFYRDCERKREINKLKKALKKEVCK